MADEDKRKHIPHEDDHGEERERADEIPAQDAPEQGAAGSSDGDDASSWPSLIDPEPEPAPGEEPRDERSALLDAGLSWPSPSDAAEEPVHSQETESEDIPELDIELEIPSESLPAPGYLDESAPLEDEPSEDAEPQDAEIPELELEHESDAFLEQQPDAGEEQTPPQGTSTEGEDEEAAGPPLPPPFDAGPGPLPGAAKDVSKEVAPEEDIASGLLLEDQPLEKEQALDPDEREALLRGDGECLPSQFCSGRVADAFVWDDGESRRLVVDGHVASSPGIGSFKGFLYYIADFGESGGIGVLNVQGNPKYAEVLARKRLEERGELTPEDSLVIYHKLKESSVEASILYQVVPKARYRELMQMPARHAGGMVVFDTLAVLRGLALRLPTDKPRALAMHLESTMLVLVARGEQCFLARRYTLLGDGESALHEAMFTIRQDIEMIQGALPGPVEDVCLIEPMLQRLEAPAEQHEEMHLRLLRWPLDVLQAEEGELYSSLPRVVRCLPLNAEIGKGRERLLRSLELFERYALVAMLLLALLAGGLGYLFFSANNALEQENTALRQHISVVQEQTPALLELPQNSVAPYLALAESVNRAQSAPSFAALWQELAAAKPEDVCLQRLSMEYKAASVQVDLQASIKGDLARTQLVQLQFLRNLEAAGFSVEHRTLSLDNEQRGDFALHLQRFFTPGTVGAAEEG